MINFKPSALKEIKPHEYAVRFFFGGICTAAAGWIAHRFGPQIGGLFLAFPAIFPASASLIEIHERERKQQAGMSGTNRGREAAGVDAAGATLGAFGLAVFGLLVWLALPRANSALVIASSAIAWMLVVWLLWMLRKSRLLHRKPHRT